MGQQFYTIRRMPAPGSLAEKALEERRIKSGKEHKKFSIPGLSHDDDPSEVQDTPATEPRLRSGQRQQPTRRSRGKSVGAAGVKPPGAKRPGAKRPGAKRPGAKDTGNEPDRR